MSGEITIPAFPNRYPYNELLLDGKLQTKGGLNAKTRSWNWKHRGLTLLYTSSRSDHVVSVAHGLEPQGFTKGVIVGCADLTEVRHLSNGEKLDLFRAFNNLPSRSAARRVMRASANAIWPLPIGFFFEDLQRFEDPIPFKPPRGAVRTFRVPIGQVEDQLRKLGHDIRQLRRSLVY
jgi:hypothetical protein